MLSSLFLQLGLHRIGQEIALTAVFVFEVGSVGGLIFQALRLSVKTIYNRASAQYWRSFVFSILLTIVLGVLEAFFVADLRAGM